MAVIKKFAEVLTQNLTSFGTFIVDNTPNSEYFKITEFKDTFTGGKNGFLIEGSEHLKESTEIKIQILDVDGNPVYYEPGNGIPEYYEGTSKLVAVYVYDDTPIGSAKITILGELKTYVDEGGVILPIPDEWKDVYNVKWEKTFQINKLLSNEDKVRFYKRPVVNIDEIVKPIFNNVTVTITQTGSLSGISQSPIAGQRLSDVTTPTNYLLRINDSTNWTGSVVGTTISIPSLGYSTIADSVISNKELLVRNPYTEDNTGLGSAYATVANFSNAGYTASFNYTEGVNNLKTALTGSFAKINLSELTTFVGDCARVRIFRKSQSDLADYQFVQEIRLESNELLRDLESSAKNEEFYGIFDAVNFKNYWVTSSNNISTTFNQSYLFNSIKLDSNGVNNFYTSKSLDITEGTEYTLNFNLRVGTGQVLAGNYIKAFLSGSRQSSVNGSPTTIQIKQNISTITSDSSLLQKNELSANFKAEQMNNAKLYFEIKGNSWYLSDVSFRASQETAYSPDAITFIQGVPRTLPEETFLYRFEFYDINNNYIPVLVEASKTFNGGNLQRIQKGLVFTPRSLQFQFDSGSQPVPPTVVGFTVTKNLLTGSVTYTSQSFDFDGNELFGNDYTASITVGGGFPGLLDGITSDAPTMTVNRFTGSRSDKTIQLIKITGEVEGFTDTVIFSRVLDGFGGVNHLIRPYRGTQIRNSSTASLEIQAVRIDGVNDIEISSTTKPEKGWPDKQLHILVTGSAATGFREKFVNLAYASSSGYVKGLTTGSLGSGEINYNATFTRDSIDFRRTIYLISSQSAASDWAYNTSGSVLASIILEDLQDGLDSGTVTFNADSFTINPRTETLHRPGMAFATASFSVRGTAGGNEFVTASFKVFPSMSLNKDFVPEFWLYYTTQSCNPTIAVSAVDDNRYVIPSRATSSFVSSPLSQSKNLTLTFTYTEPWTSASVSFDKTFTIIPEGKPGDETIIFEVTPVNVTLAANSKGIVNDYKPSITQIRLKQGSRYLSFTSSISQSGTFHIAQASITASNITGGLVYFDNNYTESLIVSASSGFINLSGSITYPLIIHPYYTSSIYTQSVVQQYTKVLDGPPPIQIVISPTSVAIPADEVGYVSSYTNANTSITVKEGDDFLLYNTSSLPGTWKINSIETRTGNVWNIRTGSLVTGSASSSFGTFNRFDYPYVSASATYTIQVYPNALGSGHEYTSSVFTRTQTFTKNVSVPNARTVELKANPYTINYDRDGYKVSPEGDVELKATAQNYTGSTWFTLFYVDTDGSETLYDGPYYEGVPEYTFIVPGTDAAGPEENKTWRVKLSDGNPYTSSILNPYRAEGQLTIAGIKAGADAYKISADNTNTSITADLYNTSLTGTSIKLPTFKGVTPLINVTSGNFPAPQATDYDYLNNLIGILGYSSASIFYKSPWITLPSNRVLTTPAAMPDISGWDKPAINKSGEIVYKVEFEGYSNNVANTPKTRQTEFVTQSFAVQFTEPAPYDVKLTRENAAAVYKVSGEMSLANTSTQIFANRGTYALVNKPAGFTGAQTDAYGSSSYQQQFRVQISAKSGHITLDNGNLGVGSYLTGTTTANMPGVTSWTSPETNRTAIIVYEINCEGRQTFLKTQSLSVQFEGETGPGIVMRGEWDPTLDYIGGVETTNNRRDAVTYLATGNDVKYYAAISGSGPNTYDQNGVLVNYHAPTPSGNNDWWEYLGDQEFFVAAKIAIFEESYVKNTINVGTYNNTSKYANIILAGGRPDPYISVGQHGTVGTAGTSGTSYNPSTAGAAGTSGTGVIGYDRPGIWMGLYEQGASGTYGRLSIKDYSGNNYMKWDGEALILSGLLNAGGMKLGRGVNGANNGLYLNANNYWYDTGNNFKVGGSSNYLEWDGTTLTLRGSLKQTSAGANEGRLMGAWASGVAYLTNDIVTYSGNTWTSNSDHTSTNNTNAGTGYPGYGPWTIAPISAKTLRMAASSQVFIEAKDGTLSPDWVEFSVSKQNISATTNWTTSPSVTLYNASSGGSTTTTGDTVYLRKADFGSNTLVEVTATADSLSDSISVARVQEGTDGLTIILTNESHTLAAANDGTVSDYNGSGTNILLYEGATQLDYDGVGTAAGKFTVSTAVSNITAGSITDGGNYATVGNHSNMTADQATVTYTISGKKINGDSFSVTKVQSLTKSKQGAAGANGTDGAAGAGVVYRGPFTIGTQYFRNPSAPAAATRRDVVKGNDGAYYLCKLTYTPTDNSTRPPDGGSYTTYWESFGATFSSVATDILLAQNATITRGLVLGQENGTSGFIRSADADTLITGSNPGFYLAEDGQFRFGHNPEDVHYGTVKPPYIKWDNTTLTIRGKIETDDNEISRIGNWKVDNGSFLDSTEQIVLDANNKQIYIADTSDIPRVFVKQGLITTPSTSTTVVLDALTTPSLPASSGVGSVNIDETTFDTTGFSVSIPGTYYLGTPSWSGGDISLTAPISFNGYGFASVHLDIYDTPDYTGNLIWSYTLASTPVGINSGGDEDFTTFTAQAITVTFPAVDTYYIHSRVFVYGYADNAFTIGGTVNPSSVTLNLQQAQTEIGSDGFIVLADNNNYASIKRTTTEPIINIKTNAGYAALQITNSSTSGRAIEVLDGDIFLSGTAGGSGANNNNIRIQGGWIGTNNSTGGIRMATDGSNSVLVGGNFPSQASNVATARLRIGTKLGISGRELIFDSSTIRVKTNIEDYPHNAYDSIKKLKPILYSPLKVIDSTRYLTDGEDDYTSSYPMPNPKEYIGKQGGFIAEWLDEDPEMRRYVSYGVSGSLITKDAINYDMIVVPLTKAVQILMDKVEALEAYISGSN